MRIKYVGPMDNVTGGSSGDYNSFSFAFTSLCVMYNLADVGVHTGIDNAAREY